MYLVDLELTNIRAIRHMSLDFRSTNGHKKTRRWTVLLGENGCGKSTVLKSIGLLLAGSEALPDLLGSTDQWIHNDAKQATISATICTAEGDERKLTLVLNRGDGRDTVIIGNEYGLRQLDVALRKADRNYFIAGYGAFRRPPDLTRRSNFSASNVRGRAAQLATLFSFGDGLVSLEEWAMDLDYVEGTKGRNIIADALGKLLPGMHFKGIDKSNRTVVMKTVDGDVPLRQLSEGYQAMAAWAGDLLFRMTDSFRNFKAPLAARGVMLIDEMDLHLHPVWKRNLVDFLDSAFPNLQIIATTHSPLSVQQCGEGELFVVRREAAGPTLVPFVGDPSRLRLSELFLSPLIGLQTLDSPKVAALREKAREIELKSGRRSAKELAKLRSIQRQLDGTTPLTAKEAPAFAELIAYQRSQPSADAEARIKAAQQLFGTKRVTVPPSTPAAEERPTNRLRRVPRSAVGSRHVGDSRARATATAGRLVANQSASTEKAVATKPQVKKAVVKSTPLTEVARKSAAKKAPVKKMAVKKVAVKKVAVKKVAAKKVAAKKVAAKKVAVKKMAVKKVAAKKVAAKKVAAKKVAAKKVAAKKVAAKKVAAKKVAAKKAAI
ncbi:putative ATP-binding protein involved in virulence [Paraburkholderia sp. BL18I3N2]|uniref:AAA family ATPase n=1 Tax=Paraburkholderia sp. BL18I3N2 TaxID=1938799 RepID=UPI000D05D16A|nr:AAA family ATPase [Paraburkholderia sp. BL18I3N2]PRX20723.1 putative ATP-binding protein involved in virulence [Paraburkholderia sp. BL18I3N2]